MKHTFVLALLAATVGLAAGCERPTAASGAVVGTRTEQEFSQRLIRFQSSLVNLTTALHEPGQDDGKIGPEVRNQHASSTTPFSDSLDTLDADQLRAMEDVLKAHEWRSAREWAAFGDALSRLYIWQQQSRGATKLEARISQLEAAGATQQENGDREIEALTAMLADLRRDAPKLSPEEQALAAKFGSEIERTFATLAPSESPASSAQ